ncbi:MAG: tyrosine-protein phosphatase [Clostridia bacterium]|nr:tyrosine-protein phosphatase [Clostridia bacterium]
MTELISPARGAVLSVLTDVQREFLRRQKEGLIDGSAEKHYWDSSAFGWLPGSRDPRRDLTAPAAVLIRFRTDDPLAPVKVEVSERDDFSVPAAVTIGRIEQSAEEEGVFHAILTNLTPGRRYFWRVTAGELSATGEFSARDEEMCPKDIEGTANVRDIGGYPAAGGKRIKYGLFYRGGALDSRVEDRYRLTRRGKETVNDVLKIRTEIDLRGEDGVFHESEAGPDLKYVMIPSLHYSDMIRDEGPALLKRIFELLCDRENYPVYIHCQAGADRTGVAVMFLLGLLGVPDDVIEADYNVTSLSIDDRRDWRGSLHMDDFLATLGGISPAPTVSESLRNFLYTVGIPAEKLDGLRDFFLDATKGDLI